MEAIRTETICLNTTQILQELDCRLDRPLGIIHPFMGIRPGHLGTSDAESYRLVVL